MKKTVLSVVTCILLSGLILAQDKYSVPVRTGDQKHARTLFQLYWSQAAAISFAKEHGISPFEYGRYIGNLAAPTWGPGNDYEALVKGIIYNVENFRHVSDAALDIKENEDGSVIIIANDKMMHKYFPEGEGPASYEEYKECMKGTFDPIANHMGAAVSIDTKDTLMIITIKKK